MPIEPPPSPWLLDLGEATPHDDLVGIGADLEPGTLLMAYRAGLFPMGLGDDGTAPTGWWSPDPRGVLLPGQVRVSRSLRRSLRQFDIRVDTAFPEVIRRCADPSREGCWITPEIMVAYTQLHELGWAHSVEAWRGDELLGGLYGLALGGLFAGESMFHLATDASKCALVGLADLVFADGDSRRLIDVQWATAHLTTLGIAEIPRSDYLARLEGALSSPLPTAFDSSGRTSTTNRRYAGPADSSPAVSDEDRS
jgi:leucyl/phenylalanyl-tRNA--protein transferase